MLAELKARHDEWDQIPVAEADLEFQELAQAGSDEVLKREKQESIINLYLSAIELGSRNPIVMRRTVELLLTTGRSKEAIQLFSRIPAATQFGSDLGRYRGASRRCPERSPGRGGHTQGGGYGAKAVAANPGEFKERLWLVQILLYGKRTAEAEAELRRAVADAEGDPERWRTLVFFLIDTKQLPKAEQAFRDAEKKLAQAPLTLAECCERIGRANEGPNTTAQAKKWYDEARHWFETALAARKDPKDLTVTRRLVEFLIRTDPAEAAKQLKEILSPGPVAKDAGTVAWARRVLAMIYINGNPRRPAEALALFDAARPQDTANPEDRRIWAKVLVAQGTLEHRRAAMASLESLVDEKLADPDDQLLLARLEEAEGNWPKSRDQYRNLIERISNLRDSDNRNRRLSYVAEFAERLLQSHQPSEDRDQDLAEAQEQIEKLKRLQPELDAIPGPRSVPLRGPEQLRKSGGPDPLQS